MKNRNETLVSNSEQDTIGHGKNLAKKIKHLPCLILLEGPVGAGKTAWVRGFVSGFLKGATEVHSPSYSLINIYGTKKKRVIHADLYRLQSEDDLESVGLWDFLEGPSVVIVEWGQMIQSYPKSVPVMKISFTILSEGERQLTRLA